MYHLHTRCRACGYGPAILPGGSKAGQSFDKLKTVFSLGVQPLANDFCQEHEERAGFAPLEVLECPRCGLAQLSVVVRPEILYSNYSYVTSKSNMMLEHFGRLWVDCFAMATRKTVCEIGSNDGDFLEFCKGNGADLVAGIEPAENLAMAANANHIPTENKFFCQDACDWVKRQLDGSPGIIFARHVFCHVDDWSKFMENLRYLCDQFTLVCIEVPYMMDQLKANSFDQIYHEHLSYLSIRAFQALLARTPFHLRKIIRYPIHGGAIVLVIQKNSGIEPDESVKRYEAAELTDGATWANFADRSHNLIASLSNMIRGFANQGKRVAGFGASAKSTVWINAMGLGRTEMQGVYDCTPQKWYKTIPGTSIPVIHEGAFYVDNPDYAVCFAWNFCAEIINKNEKWIRGGGKFIIPVPEPRVIGVESLPPQA